MKGIEVNYFPFIFLGHQLLNEEMTEKERLDLENTEVVCRRFLAWNLQDETKGRQDGQLVMAKLAMMLGLYATVEG